MKNLSLVLIIGTLLFVTPAFAQRSADIEGGKDYPLISRFEGAVIEFYKETKWGTYMLPVSDKGTIDWDGPMALEGRVIRIQYTVSPDNNSEFVLHNYKAAFKKAGFEVLIAIANDQLGVSDRPHTWNDKYYETGGYYNGLNNVKFGRGLKPGSVVALVGQLGAGKTVFTKGIAKALAVKGHEYVNSPSFVILKVYKGKKPLYHFDLYRLESSANLETVGYEEYFYSDGISVVEWADRARDVLPENYIEVRFKHRGGNEREIEL